MKWKASGLLAAFLMGVIVAATPPVSASLFRLYDRVTGGVIDADRDDAEFDNLYSELTSHVNATNPHTNSLDATGDSMTGNLIMSASSILFTTGNGKVLGLPSMTTAQIATMTSGWGSSEVGRQWYNSDTNQAEGWNGSSISISW